MGAFLSLLGGLSEGAGDTFGKIADERRQAKTQNDRLAANAILDDLKNNDQHTPEEQEALQRHYFKLLGVDNKVADGIVQASHYHRQAMQESARQAAYGKQQPQLGGGDQTAPATTLTGGPDGAPDQTLPAMPMAPTAGLPQLPPPPSGFQPKTAGQLRFEEAEPRTMQAESDKATAARQAARDAAIGTIDDKLEILKKYDGTPMEAEVRQLVGAAPKGVGAKSRALAGTMSGAAVKKELDAQGKDSSDINVNSSYRASVDSNGKLLPDSIHETEQPTRAGTASLGSYWIKMFPTDTAGNPVNENAMYVPIRRVNGGTPIGIYPVSELGSQHQLATTKTMTATDGSTFLVPITETSTTQKTANGQPVQNAPGQVPGATPATAQVAGPPPTPPGATPGPTPNAGPAPVAPLPGKPTPGQPVPRSATPSSPLPQRNGVTVGAPIAIPGAGRPLTPEQKQKNEQVAEMLNNSIGGIKDLQTPESQKILSNLISSGKIQMQIDPNQGFWRAIINKNMTLTPQEAQVASDWQLLTEGVLQMRIPMGGAGFRGPEGFGAIESNKGILSQHPEIIKRVLAGTLREFKAQRDPLVKNAPVYGYDVKPEMTADDIRRQAGTDTAKKNPFR